MKKLISLISGEGKSKKKLKKELAQAYKKYQEISKDVKKESSK